MGGLILKPNIETKLDTLANAAKYDVCLSSCQSNGAGRGRVPDPLDPAHRWIFPAHMPGGGRISILKVLQTNHCKNRCSYCAFGIDHDNVRRMGFTSQELADTFMQLVYRRLVHGLFLSSGVCNNPASTMERMVRTADILRTKYKFKGYIHLKILPGAPFNLVEKATELATRISVNIEAPSKAHLSRIAPDKQFASDLMTRMKWAGDLIKNKKGAFSQTTQFVVGASDESDLVILRATDWIYREMFVYRAYYSAWQQVREGQKAGLERSSLLREHRLYQSDFLMRGYGFRFPDLVFDQNGEIPRDVDPKTAYAMLHPELFPVDINKADEYLLLRVPGIGPVSARRIVESRSKDPFRSIEELKGVGASAKKAAPYVEFSGKGISQLRLFETPPPSDWHTGLKPAGKADLENRQLPASSVEPKYDYPAQKGRRLYYSGFKTRDPILCR